MLFQDPSRRAWGPGGDLRVTACRVCSRRTPVSHHPLQAVRRGVIRFLVLVVDCSENMNQRDMRPTRLQCAHQVCRGERLRCPPRARVSIELFVCMLACMRVQQPDPAAVLAATCAWQVVLDFIENYFDQNPISQLALIQLREGKAEKITELSGNQRHHKSKLDEYMAKQKYLGHGPASLRAGLEVSSSSDFRCARLCATLTPGDAVLACTRVLRTGELIPAHVQLASSQLEMQASYGVREVCVSVCCGPWPVCVPVIAGRAPRLLRRRT